MLIVLLGFFGVVLCYTRPPPRQTVSVPHDDDDSSDPTPQQVLLINNPTIFNFIYIILFLSLKFALFHLGIPENGVV